MNHIEQALKKSQEGGYGIYSPNSAFMMANGFLMEKDFWECLGKSLGWEQHKCLALIGELCGSCWSSYWHKFIDHLVERKAPEDFFKELLTPKQKNQ